MYFTQKKLQLLKTFTFRGIYPIPQNPIFFSLCCLFWGIVRTNKNWIPGFKMFTLPVCTTSIIQDEIFTTWVIQNLNVMNWFVTLRIHNIGYVYIYLVPKLTAGVTIPLSCFVFQIDQQPGSHLLAVRWCCKVTLDQVGAEFMSLILLHNSTKCGNIVFKTGRLGPKQTNWDHLGNVLL